MNNFVIYTDSACDIKQELLDEIFSRVEERI